MRTLIGLLFVSIVLILSLQDTAEARRGRYYGGPRLVEVDAWGRCITLRRNVWWFTRCPDRAGIYYNWTPFVW